VKNHLSSVSRPTVKGEADVTRESELGEDSIVKESLRVHNARLVVPIFETAYAEWKALGEGNGRPRPRGLERFDRGMFLRHTYPYPLVLKWVTLNRSRSHAHCAERRRGP
jgi:hypothetical protein